MLMLQVLKSAGDEMVSQVYQLSVPLTLILLVLAVVFSVVLFVSVRWCLGISCSVISRLCSQPCDSKQQQPVDDATHVKEE